MAEKPKYKALILGCTSLSLLISAPICTAWCYLLITTLYYNTNWVCVTNDKFNNKTDVAALWLVVIQINFYTYLLMTISTIFAFLTSCVTLCKLYNLLFSSLNVVLNSGATISVMYARLSPEGRACCETKTSPFYV